MTIRLGVCWQDIIMMLMTKTTDEIVLMTTTMTLIGFRSEYQFMFMRTMLTDFELKLAMPLALWCAPCETKMERNEVETRRSQRRHASDNGMPMTSV